MRYGFGWATLVVLFTAPAAFAQSLAPDSPLGCPPGRTLTVEPSGDAQLVLAEGATFEPVPVAGPFDEPRSVAFLPDGKLLLAERPGQLQLVGPLMETHEVRGIPDVFTQGHGGLLDLALDPDFAANDTIYLSYLQGDEAASTIRVLRAKLDEPNETLTEQQVIFESSPGARPEQLGGRLALTPDGYLFLSIGDRWASDSAQDLSNDLGSIIRIRTDGSIPDDNPFRWLTGARPEIWSYGHRNPQGLAFNASTGRLWSDEHGPRGGRRAQFDHQGHNYGWPVITYGIDYSGQPIGIGSARPRMEQPVRYWVPLSIAPSGLAGEGDLSHESLWISALAGEMLVRLTFGDNCAVSEEHFLKNQLGRLRDVRIDPSGVPYVLTDGGEGMLYRLDRAPDDANETAKTHL
jgi:glucose/arabinose dehydrogenase